MRNLIVYTMFIVLLFQATGCAGSFRPNIENLDCDPLEVSDILIDPPSFDGKRVCVRGKINLAGFDFLEPAFSDDSYRENDDYYDRVIFLDFTRISTDDIYDGDIVIVDGLLKIDRNCWDAWEARKFDPDGDLCVPFSRPIGFYVKAISRN